MGGSFAGLQVDVGGQWLLNCLVVVIIGGMGSLAGAAVGALLYAFVFNFSAIYLPTTSNNCCTEYSIVFTFALLALVLAFRPQGLFGKAGMTAPGRHSVARGRDRGARRRRARPVPLQRLHRAHAADAGVLARDRRGEPHLPLGVRRHGLALPDLDVRDRGLRAREHRHDRRGEGAPSRLEPVARRRARNRRRDRDRPPARRALEPELRDLLPDAHVVFAVLANYFFGQITILSGFSGISGIQIHTPGIIGNPNAPPRPALLPRSRRWRWSCTSSSATSAGRRSGSRSRESATTRSG